MTDSERRADADEVTRMMLEAAISYRCRGWRAFPVAGKVPRLAAWPTQATTDEATLRRWWRRWPTADLGIATGDGLVVLDVDPRHGGDASLAELERRHGPLPDTPRALTGGGGVHIYLTVDQIIRNRAGLVPGIDLRGDGGFVVTPPSLHASGRRYVWELGASPPDVPVAPAPGWLLQLLGAAGVDRLCIDGAPLVIHRGERNHRLHQLACLLRRYGLRERAILGCLEAINREHATPPLEPDELARIAASAARYAPAPDPRQNSHAGRPDEDTIIARALGIEWS